MTKRHPKAGDHIPTDVEKIDTVDKVVEELLETKAYQGETLKWQATQLAKLKVTNASLQEAVAWRESQVNTLNKSEGYLKADIAQLERAIASNGEALDWRKEQVEERERKEQVEELEREQLKRNLEYLQGQHDATLAQLRDFSSQHESTGWKFVLWVRQIRDKALPARSRRHGAYEKLMTRVRSRLGG